MNTGHSPLPVRDAEAARDMEVEPARPAAPKSLLDLLSSLTSSFIKEGVDDYLDRILGWGAAPLEPEEIRKLVPRLQGCLWYLVTDALQRVRGRPDKDLIKRVGLACGLDAEGSAKGFTPTDSYARRLASLVLDLLDLVADDDDGPLPDFGSAPAESRWSA
ncbi:DUF6415 family natural product biosynthesis protein [Streptantibioticus ferralitis]|uniref:DUF6415 family natural product biosynthesis protein n=1 Tax=Streptantibioticus ferralitis TaxID=236510 RepID=A0ABT5Z0G4_9ACTN|nr:DUF6415 family natural product biosynthesis protein [Streptantibioticus ferralitis]MDF2257199.1 DUF6415 family natural product biosynthesis protein [Streptantibioticus ferralitis]